MPWTRPQTGPRAWRSCASTPRTPLTPRGTGKTRGSGVGHGNAPASSLPRQPWAPTPPTHLSAAPACPPPTDIPPLSPHPLHPNPQPPRYQDAVRQVIKDCHEEVQVILEEHRDALWAGAGAARHAAATPPPPSRPARSRPRAGSATPPSPQATATLSEPPIPALTQPPPTRTPHTHPNPRNNQASAHSLTRRSCSAASCATFTTPTRRERWARRSAPSCWRAARRGAWRGSRAGGATRRGRTASSGSATRTRCRTGQSRARSRGRRRAGRRPARPRRRPRRRSKRRDARGREGRGGRGGQRLGVRGGWGAGGRAEGRGRPDLRPAAAPGARARRGGLHRQCPCAWAPLRSKSTPQPRTGPARHRFSVALPGTRPRIDRPGPAPHRTQSQATPRAFLAVRKPRSGHRSATPPPAPPGAPLRGAQEGFGS
jgi:hypothetical protein